MIIFETERLLVRQFTTDDQENFYRINSHPKVMEYIRPVKNQEETDHFLKLNIEQYNTEPKYGRWAAIEKSTGIAVGSFAIIPIEGTAKMQVGYALMPEYWGKGYATELARSGVHYFFGNTVIDVVYAVAEQPNTASENVLFKVGFTISGYRMEEGKKLIEYSLGREKFMQSNK